jgi:hypothetical protein
MLIRKTICAVALILLTAGTFGAPSFAATTVGQDNANPLRTESGKRLRPTSPRRQVASTKGSKLAQRTIIFVGGKKGSQGAAKTSNPRQPRKVNGASCPGGCGKRPQGPQGKRER